MNISSDAESFEKLNINPYHTSDKLIKFSAKFSKDCFSISHLNVMSMNRSFENLKDLIASQTNPFKVFVLTETSSADEKAHNNSLFLNLNSYMIPQVRKCSHERGGVVVFIHKSVNFKVIHDLRWATWLV